MARCMLIDANLPNKYWGEAVCTANYLQNRLYTKTTEMTPFERWHKRKSSLQHIHVFGSKAYAHVSKELRRKLDEKAKEFVFVGYAEDAKGYRLLDKSTDKVIVSRDVNFLEDGSEAKEVIIQNKQEQETQHNVANIYKTNEEENEDEEDNQEECKSDQDESHEGQERRRSQRHNKGIPPKRYCSLAHYSGGEEMLEPDTYEEAMSSINNSQWIKSMKEEYGSLINANMWTLVDKPINKNVVGCKWVYKTKTDAQGQVVKHKAILKNTGSTMKKCLLL